ncbi:heat shock protein HslJ [Sphingosinicella soli]|uniref:Heat shock protein HslJ n=1 Tax=Sphingosinicella soli TaxID=333708 RepID=A0A7W7B230_9SPHN|nr:heat shock protein HslJ [Sphingosinicella soli]
MTLAGCAASSEQAPAPAPVVNTLWTGQTVAGDAPAAGSRFELMFGPDGRISGRSGCNSFGAGYALNGAALQVHPPIIGTRMACSEAVMAQEARFLAIIETATTASVGTDSMLTVTGPDGRAIRFAKADVPSNQSSSHANSAMPMPTPSHVVMRCGDEQLRVRIEGDTAEVVLDDGSEMVLPRLEGETGAAQTYTNGRMTLQRVTEPQHGFRFARGRMALMPCILAQN